MGLVFEVGIAATAASKLRPFKTAENSLVNSFPLLREGLTRWLFLRGVLGGVWGPPPPHFPAQFPLSPQQECVSFQSFSSGNYLVELQDFRLFGSMDSHLITNNL
jgi:hypothetical protein